MKAVVRMADMGALDQKADVRALVAYENMHLAQRAGTVLKRVWEQSGEPGELIYTLWKFESLAVKAWQEMAAAEARAADIVLIAARDGLELPDAIKEWIALWLATNDDRPKALVALLEPDAHNPLAPRCLGAQLEKVARLAHMDFFADAGGDELAAVLRWGTPPIRALGESG